MPTQTDAAIKQRRRQGGAGLYSIIEYEAQVKAGTFVVIAHGSADEVSKTKGTLALTKHQGIKEHASCA